MSSSSSRQYLPIVRILIQYCVDAVNRVIGDAKL